MANLTGRESQPQFSSLLHSGFHRNSFPSLHYSIPTVTALARVCHGLSHGLSFKNARIYPVCHSVTGPGGYIHPLTPHALNQRPPSTNLHLNHAPRRATTLDSLNCQALHSPQLSDDPAAIRPNPKLKSFSSRPQTHVPHMLILFNKLHFNWSADPAWRQLLILVRKMLSIRPDL
jgi:hypothetical protein